MRNQSTKVTTTAPDYAISPNELLESGLPDPPPSKKIEFEIIMNVAKLMVKYYLGRWTTFSFAQYRESFPEPPKLSKITKIYLDNMASKGYFTRTSHDNPIFSSKDTYTPTEKLLQWVSSLTLAQVSKVQSA